MIVTNNTSVIKIFKYRVNGEIKNLRMFGGSVVNIPDLTSELQILHNQYGLKIEHINDTLDRNLIGEFSIEEQIIPTSSNATVQVWINKIGSDGYAYPSQEKVDIYTSAFDYADAQGLTTEIDLLGLLKVENEDLCKVPFIHSAGSSARFNLVSSPTFTANLGLKSLASGYLDTNWIETTHGIQWASGNASHGVFVEPGFSANSNSNAMGTSNGSDSESIIVPRNNAAVITVQDINNFPNVIVETASGFTVGSLLNDEVKLIKNGVTLDTQPGSLSYPLSSFSTFVLCYNAGGIPQIRYPGNIQFFYKGSGDINQTNMNTFVNMLLL